MDFTVLKFVWVAVFIWGGYMVVRAKKRGGSNDICAAVLPIGILIGISASTVISMLLVN